MVIELPPDFREFLKLLNDHAVEYLVVGGFAVAYHGYPRATNDLDVWIRATPQNADRIVQAIREFGFDLPQLTPEVFLKSRRIVRMGNPPIRIEVMNDIDGVDFAECVPNAAVADVDGVAVPVIGLEDLKSNKQASGRPRDLDDLENLP